MEGALESGLGTFTSRAIGGGRAILPTFCFDLLRMDTLSP